MQIQAGRTGVTIPVKALDSSSTVGAGLSGLAYNTAGLVASYWREGGTRTAITLATLAAVDSAWSSGGFKEVDATNLKGSYRLDVPDAALATAADWVILELYGATNMMPVTIRIDLVGYDPQDAGLTAAEISTEVVTDLDLAVTVRGQMDQALIDYDGPTNAELATALGTADDAVLAILGAPAGASLAADLAAVKSDTASAKSVTDILNTMIVNDGSPNGYIFTVPALLNASGSGLDAAGVRAALGMAAANMDTQLGALSSTLAGLNDLTTAEVGDAVLDEVVESTLTLRHSIRLMLSFISGNATGLGTGTEAYKDVANSKTRIGGTVSGGTRTVSTRDGT